MLEGPNIYKKNFVAFQCALDMFKAEFGPYSETFKDLNQVEGVEKLVQDSIMKFKGSKKQLTDQIIDIIWQNKTLSVWSHNFLLRHKVSCLVSKYVKDPEPLLMEEKYWTVTVFSQKINFSRSDLTWIHILVTGVIVYSVVTLLLKGCRILCHRRLHNHHKNFSVEEN
ncbi:hypothetical protein RF11_14862 [Thelohanellus kitauei]|uniref:Uncharacterized protein n=1 Tax=Thelohanellus kitauei TaxID=669202 RepID=A0A0C2IYF1_THEKT|nr:hypothetical protein RF11_14862 [Thelohanellus kitauei]